MKEPTNKLAAIQAHQIVTLLRSLHSRLDDIVTTREAQLDDLTLDSVHQPQLNEEQKRISNTERRAALVSKRNRQTSVTPVYRLRTCKVTALSLLSATLDLTTRLNTCS